MNDQIAVAIILAFCISLAVANFIFYGAESAGTSISYSLITGPILYGIYKLGKYLYKKSKMKDSTK